MTQPLTDGTYTLRPPGVEDARSHFEAVLESVPEVSAWLEWAHDGYRIEESAAFIDRAIAGHRTGDLYEFFIVDADGRFLGGAGLNRVDARFMRANLGYWVRTSAAGRGVAAAAARLLARFGFEQLGLQRIEIIAAVDNEASQRVAEKVGGHREGVLRNGIRFRGKPIDSVCFSLIPGDVR
ncbi:MAG TPA: GNAT family protein [Actinomycetota bacterium]|nr:GNAT family protein [Actinomycetota bacterium]